MNDDEVVAKMTHYKDLLAEIENLRADLAAERHAVARLQKDIPRFLLLDRYCRSLIPVAGDSDVLSKSIRQADIITDQAVRIRNQRAVIKRLQTPDAMAKPKYAFNTKAVMDYGMRHYATGVVKGAKLLAISNLIQDDTSPLSVSIRKLIND